MLDITKKNQALDFPVVPNLVAGQSSYQLKALATSGLDVVYSVVSGPVAVTGNLVSVTGVGTAIIKASQPGNDEFNPAQEITQTFTVSKLNQTVTFPVVAALTYGDAAASLTATADSGLPVSYSVVSGPCTLVGNRLTATAAGEIVVRASLVVTDDIPQAKTEAAELIDLAKAGKLDWNTVKPLHEIGRAHV